MYGLTLTEDQINFLAQQQIPLSQVFDATGLSKSAYRELMKQLDKNFAVGVSPCRKAGHQLRTRAGHCAQCDPAKIAFQLRHSANAFVYIAGAKSNRVVKVGVTKDPSSRIASLNASGYGGIDDWVCLFQLHSDNAGRLEFEAHSHLDKYASPRAFTKEGCRVDCLEIFSCSVQAALESVSSATKNALKMDQLVSDSELQQYQFPNVTGSSFVRTRKDETKKKDQSQQQNAVQELTKPAYIDRPVEVGHTVKPETVDSICYSTEVDNEPGKGNQAYWRWLAVIGAVVCLLLLGLYLFG